MRVSVRGFEPSALTCVRQRQRLLTPLVLALEAAGQVSALLLAALAVPHSAHPVCLPWNRSMTVRAACWLSVLVRFVAEVEGGSGSGLCGVPCLFVFLDLWNGSRLGATYPSCTQARDQHVACHPSYAAVSTV